MTILRAEPSQARQSGLTLIEATVTILWIGMTVMAAVILIKNTGVGYTKMRFRTAGDQLALAKAEEIKRMLGPLPWSDVQYYINSGYDNPTYEQRKFLRVWKVEWIRENESSSSVTVNGISYASAMAYPVNTPGANPYAAPSNMVRITVQVYWAPKGVVATPTAVSVANPPIEQPGMTTYISYLSQRYPMTIPNPSPTPKALALVSGLVTVSGKPVPTGALVQAVVSGTPFPTPPLLPATMGNLYEGVVGPDGRYQIALPASYSGSVTYNIRVLVNGVYQTASSVTLSSLGGPPPPSSSPTPATVNFAL